MPDLASDGLNHLNARGGGADHADALALQVQSFLGPLRGVNDSTLEALGTRKRRHHGHRQAAGAHNEELRADRLAVVGGHRPTLGRFVVAGAGDPGLELDVATQVELVSHVVEVALGFRLPGKALAPVPLVQQILGEPILVDVSLRIDARAGVAVPVPGAADAGASLEHLHLQALIAQLMQRIHPGKAGADDDGIYGLRCLCSLWHPGGLLD